MADYSCSKVDVTNAPNDDDGEQPPDLMHWYVTLGWLPLVRQLLENGASPDGEADRYHGRCPLTLAVLHKATSKRRSRQMAEVLLSAGAKQTSQDLTGRTALSYAAQDGDVNMLQLLLRFPDASDALQLQDVIGRTALHYAVESDSSMSVLTIVAAYRMLSLNVDVPDSSGTTPLMQAVRQRSAPITRVLVVDGQASSSRAALHGYDPSYMLNSACAEFDDRSRYLNTPTPIARPGREQNLENTDNALLSPQHAKTSSRLAEVTPKWSDQRSPTSRQNGARRMTLAAVPSHHSELSKSCSNLPSLSTAENRTSSARPGTPWAATGRSPMDIRDRLCASMPTSPVAGRRRSMPIRLAPLGRGSASSRSREDLRRALHTLPALEPLPDTAERALAPPEAHKKLSTVLNAVPTISVENADQRPRSAYGVKKPSTSSKGILL